MIAGELEGRQTLPYYINGYKSIVFEKLWENPCYENDFPVQFVILTEVLKEI